MEKFSKHVSPNCMHNVPIQSQVALVQLNIDLRLTNDNDG